MTTGQRLQQARKAANLSQRELGQRLGVSGSMLGQYENDLRNPKLETLQRIADVLGVDVNWLRTGTDSGQPLQEEDQPAPFPKDSEAILQLLGFLELPPEKAMVFKKSYMVMRLAAENICSGYKGETNPDNLQIYLQVFVEAFHEIKDLFPGEFEELQQRYRAHQIQDREYKEYKEYKKYEGLLTKCKRLTKRSQRELEKYMDYLIFCQENDRKDDM